MYTGIGTYSEQDLAGLILAGHIVTLPGYQEKHIGPASIDLTVSKGEAYRVDFLMRPSGKRHEKVRDMLPALGARRVELGSVLEPGAKYVAKATINIGLPSGVYGFGNAKSTSGRNMCLARILVDDVEGYDTLYRPDEVLVAEVWLTLEPLVFPIILTDKECYSQVRIFNGDTRFTDADLKQELARQPLLYRQNGDRYPEGELTLFSGDGTVFTTLYAKAGKLVGFRARKTLKPLDLVLRELDPRDYFEPVYAEVDPSDSSGGRITLEPGWYYLLSTNEQMHVPEHLCAELIAVNPRFGLFFSHFAGFFDPGFRGTPTLEVTCLIPTTMRHREAVGCFRYEHMCNQTTSYKDVGNYAGQRRTTLPKQFVMPEEWQIAMG